MVRFYGFAFRRLSLVDIFFLFISMLLRLKLFSSFLLREIYNNVMSIFNLNHVSYQVADKTILSDISLSVEDGERVT